ncbi:MAG: carbon-nitrogen family hydrolase [Pelosinus sp.]|nr:carbon-nitrogen family hydrolase [Pelosinus sp.]
MKIALLQMDIVLGNTAANRRKAKTMIEEGLRQKAKLFVLPELWTTGYILDSLLEIGEAEDGLTVRMLQNIAQEHGVEIVSGSIAEIRNSRVYNTVYAINTNGEIVGKYSKIHLVPMMNEAEFLTAGDAQGIFDLSFGKAGAIICYDVRFPELSRSLALNGCQTMFVSAEWPAGRGKHWRILNMARAVENQMFVFAVNRVGRDVDNTFYGHSMLINPWGDVIAEGSENEEQVIIADVDFGMVEKVRKQVPVFAGRRPECY